MNKNKICTFSRLVVHFIKLFCSVLSVFVVNDPSFMVYFTIVDDNIIYNKNKYQHLTLSALDVQIVLLLITTTVD